MISWLLLFFATIALFVYAGDVKRSKICKGIKVEIVGQKKYVFVNEEQIKGIIAANGGRVGYVTDSIDLKKLEQVLYADVWVKKADLYFDNNQVLQVRIAESDPIARIFTDQGNTFYIDSSAKKLPVNSKVSARVPVFTSFPEAGNIEADTLLIKDIQRLSSFINSDTFWTAMIAQINIVNKNQFEFVPVVGNHMIAIGTADSIENKFNRLYSFYQQVWVAKGLDKYKKIDVQYNGQVVATLRDSANRNDAVFGIPVRIDTVSLADTISNKNIPAKQAQPKTGAANKKNAATQAQERKKPPPAGAAKQDKHATINRNTNK